MSDHDSMGPQFVLPPGTQVVLRTGVKATSAHAAVPAGAVGVVIKSPVDAGHAYRVRLVDGIEVSLPRQELSVRKRYQAAGLREAGAALQEHDLRQDIIYRCVIGSRAYGLEGEESDTDRRGIYLPPAELHWSLYGVPDQLEDDATQECYWDLGKFLVLALKANPNVLECLYTPLVEYASPLARELLDMRAAFLSRLVYQTYNGYVLSQFKKLDADLRNRGEIRWKHAMHLIRLLLSGVTVLREGFVPLRVDPWRERLLAVRRGGLAWDELNAWRVELHREFDAAFQATGLPEQPDYERVNAFLVRARRSVL